MLSYPLFAREVRGGLKLFVIFAAILSLYIICIVYMYDPNLGAALRQFEEMMPQVMSAFGMVNSGSTMLTFLNSYLFGFLFLLFPMIFEIMLANRLIAGYVERGSMAYLLATPNSRIRIAVTQAVYLVSSILLLIAFSFGTAVLSAHFFFPGELDIPRYLLLHVGLFILHLFISGIAFCSSCLFDDTRASYAVSVGIPLAFYLVRMLANMGDKLADLKYITFFSLFDTDALIKGDAQGVWMLAILAAAGLLLYGVGILGFEKRDLPL